MFHGVKIVTAGIPTTDIAAVYGDGRQIGTICLVDGEKVFRVEQEPVIRQNSGRLGNQQFTRFPHLGSLL